MPALGESVTEGTVTRWLKKEGDQIAIDEPLLEVSTDKVDTEIPSPVAGVLQKIVVQVDSTVAVGAELAVISESGAAAPQKISEPVKVESNQKLPHQLRQLLQQQLLLQHLLRQLPLAPQLLRCQHLANQ